MKVIVAPFAALSRYVSREFWITLMSLVWKYGWQAIETNALSPTDGLQLLERRLGRLPEVIVFWESYLELARHASTLKRSKALIYVITDDLHCEREGMFEALNAADGILSTYAPCLAEFFPDLCASKVTWVPHAAGPDFILPVSEVPENSIFVSGAMSDYYPLRLRMRNLAARHPDLVKVQQHPGYDCEFDHDRDKRVGRGYAEAIRENLAAFTDASCCAYLLAKHFEIPATGSLLLAERTVADQLRMLGFVDGEHYLSLCSEDLEDVVAWVLDPANRDAVDSIRHAGHTLVHERHTALHRAALINATCV